MKTSAPTWPGRTTAILAKKFHQDQTRRSEWWGYCSLDLTFHSLKLRSYPTSIISITVQGSTLTFFVLDMMDIRVEMRRKATGRLIKSPNCSGALVSACLSGL